MTPEQILQAIANNHDLLKAALFTQERLIEALAATMAPSPEIAADGTTEPPVTEPEPVVPRRSSIPDLCDHPDAVDTGLGVSVCPDCGANL